MAQVKPFEAIRYSDAAGPLANLVAPPYDVIDDAGRAAYLARDPHNVVHLTLPDDYDAAAKLWRAWQDEGVLERDSEPAYWWLSQTYTGPDGVERTRDGLVTALRLEPYENRVVLPHERTHAGPKEGRLKLLRALRAQVEPIFLLYDGSLAAPAGPPLLDVELDGVRNRLTRADRDYASQLADAQLLIADGHHRYETALAFHDEDGSEDSAWMMVVIVPTGQPGLTIFPTHRIVESLGPTNGLQPIDEAPLDALRRSAVLYRAGRSFPLEGAGLDAELVERYQPQGVRYTPRAEEAIRAVDSGEAEAAFLLRPPTVEQVRAVAERGDVMPQKSTYFFPKLPTGLLFQPL